MKATFGVLEIYSYKKNNTVEIYNDISKRRNIYEKN